MRIFFLAVVLFAVILPKDVEAGGGWTQKKGHGYLKFSQYAIVADQYFSPNGSITTISPRTSLYTTSLFGEYGITDRITIEAYVPFFSRAILNAFQERNGNFREGDELNSFGDTDLSLKYGIIQKGSTVLSAKVTFGLPLGNPAGGETEALQTGDGEFNQMISLDVSHSFYPIPLYASAMFGFNNRTTGFSEELRFGLELGYTFNRLTLVGKFAGVESLMNGDPDPNSVQGVFGNNIEFLSFTPEVIFQIKENFGMSASVGTAFYGRQVLANPAYEGGIYFKW